jgi:hypothetical protein
MHIPSHNPDDKISHQAWDVIANIAKREEKNLNGGAGHCSPSPIYHAIKVQLGLTRIN